MPPEHMPVSLSATRVRLRQMYVCHDRARALVASLSVVRHRLARRFRSFPVPLLLALSLVNRQSRSAIQQLGLQQDILLGF